MDNRLITIKSEGRKAFDLAFDLFFLSNLMPIKATHYVEDSQKGLIFFSYWDDSNLIKLPVPLDAKQSAELAWAWLQAQPDSAYDDYLDHDGSNHKGFKVYNEEWNRIGGYRSSILAVKPIWAWYGK